jgi:hypothetical protein
MMRLFDHKPLKITGPNVLQEDDVPRVYPWQERQEDIIETERPIKTNYAT